MMCLSGTPEEKKAAQASRQIDQNLQKTKKTIQEEIKLLLLGPGESGKSTVFKQMKIIQKNGGFSKDERMGYKSIIVSNCVTQMKVMINAAHKFNYEFAPDNVSAAQRIATLPAQQDNWNPKENLADISALWHDDAIKKTFDRRDVDFQLNDSAVYFFERATKYADDSYVPDEQDVLRSRVRTTGIDEAFFDFDGMYFRMVDVGGQRTERRKWIHCFDSVTSVIFCASLSEYDQRLREDTNQNRMIESLQLFGEICNSIWFQACSLILFLNKVDLFKEKIQVKDLNCLFEDYTGGCNYDKAAKYIGTAFSNENNNKSRPIYTHFTCAVDTGNILFVFNAVKETIMSKILDSQGFM
eukprot:TRINITY_DN1149_c0_g1_i1.p1 TRINITY_DN1149_c0_g1~~TRINITY_DN1149_c0_g1_i1.p1  ORF type:complete len:355 (-),score=139.37 TRINITY_DN1149_c0_g1_i1:145-1209(-)